MTDLVADPATEVDLATATELDWPAFVAEHWNRRPVLYRSLAQPPFELPEVFATTVRASQPPAGLVTPLTAQLTVGRRLLQDPGQHLPVAADGTFEGYQRRLDDRLDGKPYALIASSLHSFDWALWKRERDFLDGLWRQVGVPSSGAITTLFHGTYEQTPAGVHQDRFDTFMFGLGGRKRMRFWPRRPWSEPVDSVLDYQAYLPESLAVEVGPGELLYWPSSYYHVGESCGGGPATSVNIGVPRTEHHARYELTELLVDVDLALIANPSTAPSSLPASGAPLTAPGADWSGRLPRALPPALADAVRILRRAGRPSPLWDRVARLSLQRSTGGGLAAPAPSAARRLPLPPRAVVSGLPGALIRWQPLDSGGCLCAANGHVVRTAAPAGRVGPLVQRLNAGESVAAAELWGRVRAAGAGEDPDASARAELRRLLETLESFGGIARSSGHRARSPRRRVAGAPGAG